MIAPIGAGGSAVVYLADDTRLRRRVAVKLLHSAFAGDDTFVRRFRAEAQAAAALSHPHIVAVHDWSEEGDEPYLVTEYLAGGSLRGMLDKGSLLSVSQALLVGLEATRALSFAHKRGFVHRDIKPANLLFGEDGRLRIADFGLARALAEAANTEPAGALVGTARYACPEQARGDAVTAKGDVYSLGLVLIEAVTGQVPFAADTTLATLMGRVDRPVEVPAALGPLRGVIQRVGAVNPDDRPDAGEFEVGLLAAAEELSRPEPLPLAGAAAGGAVPFDVDPTAMPIGTTGPVGTAGAALPLSAGILAGVDSITGDAPPMPGGIVDSPPLTRAEKRALKDARKAEYRSGLARRRWPRIAGAILVVLALAVGGLLAYGTFGTESHVVPRLIGLTKAQALAEASSNHWKVTLAETRVDGSTPGSVIAQQPNEGRRLDEGATVQLTVSLGNTLTLVPTDLAGKTLAEATDLLQHAQLKVGPLTGAYDENAPKDTVLGVASNTPAQLPKGGSVGLTVSKGPQPRTIPNIAPGTDYAAAATALTDLGLVPKRVDAFDDDIPKGKVVSLSPAPGAEVARDSTVTVTVSKGPTKVPDVRGMSVGDATDVLQAAGYSVDGVQGSPLRSVKKTNPPAGTQLRRGSGVTLITR